jgi:acyl-CoA synthetase (NDP forming)/RimJ/RimL family protein N-acetyltransferase
MTMANHQLVRDVILSDGSTLRLRTPGPEDLPDIQAFYEALSSESRYMRFHGYGRTDMAARDYAEADGVDRVALIGRHGDSVVAAAGFDGLREPGVAEVAFAVADDSHGRGIATRMLEQLADIAAEKDIHRFDAEVMAHNRAMLSVFERAGYAVRRKGAGGEVTVSLDITSTEALKERIAERDHFGAVASLRPILAPATVAVVGASSSPRSMGGAVLTNIVDGHFQGVATAVNRSGDVVHSMRAVRDIAELEEVPDLVVVAVPATEVAEVASHAARRGAKALLVLTASLGGGDEGREREEQLLEIVRRAGMRMVGPNSLGVLNTSASVKLNATFAGASVPAGRLAICSESGAIGLGLLGHAAARRLGVSSFASIGNRADVSTNDLLELWEEDERTAAVMLYVETFGNPERFTHIARRVARRKPILAVKGHRNPDVPASDAHSRTAAGVRGDILVDALLDQAGVLRFRSGEDLFNAAEFFESQPLPNGRRIGIVSNSAGVATLAADACTARGLLAGVPEGEIDNPLVLGIQAGPAQYAEGVHALLADPGVDALMVHYVDLSGGEPLAVLETISAASVAQDKPVVASVITADGRLPAGAHSTVPNFLFPDACANVLDRAAERRSWLSRPLGQRPRYDDIDSTNARELMAPHLGESADLGHWLPTVEAESLIGTQGIQVVRSYHCQDADEAASVAAEIAGPVALKAEFAPPAHAQDIDAALLGLEGAYSVRAGWRELRRRVQSAGLDRQSIGAVVQPLMPPGMDLLVGAISDPELGPVMAIGLGGRQAGLGRTAFRRLPDTDVEADELIDASESVVAQLSGFRGHPPLDREAVRELILRFALLLRIVPEIVEADLNPVRCMVEGCMVLDLRLRIQRRLPRQAIKTW